ncbi:MAG: energy transducer TonB [Chitinophagaceae bacterium]
MIAEKIYESVEAEAYFPGQEPAWHSFLQQNLNPSVPVDKGAKAGIYTVYIQFVVSKDGSISNIKPLTKHGYGMETEVMRIIRKSPKWVPAIQNGRTVNAYIKQPVTFQIEEEKKKKRGRG